MKQRRSAVPNTRRTHWLAIVLAGIFIGLLVAGLQPFNFFPKNDVHWLFAENGIRFAGYGEVNGTDSLRGLTPGGSQDFSMELLLASYKGRRKSIESVVSVIHQRRRESFAIEIWTVDLVIAGWFHDATSGKTFFDRLFCGHVFDTTADRFVAVTSGSEGITVYVDGTPERNYPQLTLDPVNFDGKLLLGQPPGGHQEWQGAIKGLAFFDRALSPQQVVADFASWKQGHADAMGSNAQRMAIFPFREREGRTIRNQGTIGGNLRIPESLIPEDPVVLKIPTVRDWENRSDVILNVAGFIPLGFVMVTYLRMKRWRTRTKAIAAAVFVGFVTSICIELLQVYLPSRDSSLLDVIMNTSGTLIGAGLASFAVGVSSRPPRSKTR